MGRHHAHALFLSLAVLCLTAGSALASTIVVNGNFDSAPLGTGWTQDDGGSGYPPIVSGSEMPPSIPPQSAPNATWLGGLFNVTQSIYQDVAVPAGTTKLTLTGYLWITTEEPGGTFDHLYAEIITPGGSETLGHWTNLSSNTGWTFFSTQASGNYAGQTIRLRFRSTNDASFNTNFFLDTCDLDATPPLAAPPQVAPTISRLSLATPNPTRQGTHLRLDLAAPGFARVGIYDLQGRLVRRIADESLPAGSHDLTWDGTDAGGGRAASGVYICRADIAGRSFERTIALVR